MTTIAPRDLAYCGLFGAAALLMPAVFHLFHLGHFFMPMYIPLVALAFFTRPLPAALTALMVPPLSGAVTGMPPFFPPIAVFMAVELAVMSAIIATVRGRWPRTNEWLLLLPVLALGRALYAAMVFGFSLIVELPSGFMAGLSLVSGWPGMVLMMVVIPPLARAGRPGARTHATREGDA